MAELRTDRLVLRTVDADDVGFVHELFSDPLVARWRGDGVPMTLEQAEAWVERRHLRAGDHPAAGLFVVRVEARPVGIVLLVPLPPSAGHDRHVHEIGWHLLTSAWGHGYATEAGRALADRAFAGGLDEVWAVTHPDNARSQAVCARLGMTDLGLTNDWYDRSLRTFCRHRSGIEKPTEPTAH